MTDELSSLPVYVPPKIVTYTSDEILEKIGPAQACTGSPYCVNSPDF